MPFAYLNLKTWLRAWRHVFGSHGAVLSNAIPCIRSSLSPLILNEHPGDMFKPEEFCDRDKEKI